MARKKAYKEEDVIEKAMHVFWRNGYEATSVRQLEKEMGINQFSIYASFKDKKGVFIESIKCYNQMLIQKIVNKLTASNNGIEGIKEFFIDFLNFSKTDNLFKGCLLINTINEIGYKDDEISKEINMFISLVENTFTQILERTNNYSKDDVKKHVNYLLIALQGMSTASKSFKKQQLNDYVDIIFKNIK
jgi:AcrR family transcriptional regulator